MSEYPARREPPKSRFFIIHYKLRDSHVFERFVCLSQIKNVITKFKICNFWRLLNDCERIVTILETLFIVKKHYIDFDLEIPIEVCTDRSISYQEWVHVRWRGAQKDLKITDIDLIKKKHCVLASTKAKWSEKSLFGNSGHRFRFQTVTNLSFVLKDFF